MSYPLLRRALALGGALTSLLAAAPEAGAATAPPGFKPFARDSLWNLPLRGDAPLDARSAAHVAWLGGQVAAKGAYINTYTCGMPIYWADASTPTVRVRLDPSAYQDQTMLSAWEAVPIPAEAKPAKCSDANFAVLQVQPDGTVREWELWRAAKQADGSWTARWGGAVKNVGTDRGIASPLAWRNPLAPPHTVATSTIYWNVTATSVSMIAGVVTMRELAAGKIEHALSMALPDAAKGTMAWPAQRSDGTLTDPDALPQGARLRLDPSLDLTKIPMVPAVRMLAVAAQKYGIVVRDKTWNNTVFYTEEPQPGQANPLTGLLGGLYPDQALKAFPWARLQMLEAERCTGTGGCVTPQKAVISVNGTPRAGSPVMLDTSNSVLNHPRAKLQWDFDGNGTYESNWGAARTASFVPATAGTRQVGLRITTTDGTVATGSRTITVAPA